MCCDDDLLMQPCFCCLKDLPRTHFACHIGGLQYFYLPDPMRDWERLMMNDISHLKIITIKTLTATHSLRWSSQGTERARAHANACVT